MTEKEQKAKSQKMADDIVKQTKSIVAAFRHMIDIHGPQKNWKFTYSISLSAEPALEHERVVYKKRRKKNER